MTRAGLRVPTTITASFRRRFQKAKGGAVEAVISVGALMAPLIGYGITHGRDPVRLFVLAWSDFGPDGHIRSTEESSLFQLQRVPVEKAYQRLRITLEPFRVGQTPFREAIATCAPRSLKRYRGIRVKAVQFLRDRPWVGSTDR